MTFRRERLAPILREITPLFEQDWRENGIDHDKAPLRINFQQYLDYDLVGVLQIVTARDADLLVGYMLAYVHPHIDHAGMGWAMITWYWLYPQYRGGGVGDAMLKAMETFLRSAGISVVEATQKLNAPHGMFARNGYRDTDIVCRKILEE